MSGIKFVDQSIDEPQRLPLQTKSEILTAAAKGTLGTAHEDPGFPKINAPSGDIYLADGFRLPTEAEQVHLMKLEQIANGNLFTVVRQGPAVGGSAKLTNADHERGWSRENSRGSTRPVGEKKPLIVGNGVIYDILGNVIEWGHESYDGTHLIQGINPLSSTHGNRRAVRGGSYSHDISCAYGRLGTNANLASSSIGVRFVRTLR